MSRANAAGAPEAKPMEMNGRVLEALPNAIYRVELDNEARTTIAAHVSGASGLLRILPGDGVVVELMAYDMTRGRIVRKLEGKR